MDLDDLRSILRESGVNVWSLIDSAITLAYEDCSVDEIRQSRDRIVEQLYVPPDGDKEIVKEKGNERFVGLGHHDGKEHQHHEDDDNQDRTTCVDDVQMRILDIKELLEYPTQSEDDLLNLLHELNDMDIKFQVLKDTDIGRLVNLQRKHPSTQVCQIVKQLVRKWKCIVDDWVKHNSTGDAQPSDSTRTNTIDETDGHSPQQNLAKTIQIAHHQASDFNHSLLSNNHNGSSGSDKNNSEPEPKKKVVPKREPQLQRSPSPQVSSFPALPNKQKEQKNNTIDAERLASARKRLHDNYEEAQNAKKQRKIQVMDLQDIPKPKNSFFSKNKGGSQAKHW